MLKQASGFAIMCLGAMGGNSENLLIPIALIGIGIYLISSRE